MIGDNHPSLQRPLEFPFCNQRRGGLFAERGEALQTKLDYPIQTLSFSDSLAMVFLAGEVVVDYSLRLKRELDHKRIWINAERNRSSNITPGQHFNGYR